MRIQLESRCQPQVRLVSQAIDFRAGVTYDGAIHALYKLDRASFSVLVRELRVLTAFAPQNRSKDRFQTLLDRNAGITQTGPLTIVGAPEHSLQLVFLVSDNDFEYEVDPPFFDPLGRNSASARAIARANAIDRRELMSGRFGRNFRVTTPRIRPIALPVTSPIASDQLESLDPWLAQPSERTSARSTTRDGRSIAPEPARG